MAEISLKECYKTVAGCGEAEIIEKKSRFIATVRPVTDEDSAVGFISEMRSKYSDATHNVYAYVIDENNIFRYSDDREPQGTAGMPVLDTIRKENIVDAAVVVTRYFGGTLLGTGGLVHAYGKSARLGLENAKIVTRMLCSTISVKSDYALSGKIQHKIASDGIILEDTVYDREVTFHVCIQKSMTDAFLEEMVQLTNARAVCRITGHKYVDAENL